MAQENLLRVKLAVDHINKSYTDKAVEGAVRELPPGMEELYDRMVESITSQSSSERGLGNDILAGITCS
ncbi:hypothetical protein B7494_g285 [Chlorociboria aeruginascens]|nr:hypothetical protein B7494_g285 [Chlorociboria aeruginascens]